MELNIETTKMSIKVIEIGGSTQRYQENLGASEYGYHFFKIKEGKKARGEA